MFSENFWLFFRSSVFSYSKKLVLLFFGFLYTYIVANVLGPAKYGLAMFMLAFVGNLVYLFGTEPLGNTLIVFVPKYRSKKLFVKFVKILLGLFFILFALFFFFPQWIFLLLKKGNLAIFRYAAFLFLVFPLFLLFEALFKGLKSFGKVLKVSLVESFANLSLASFFVLILHQGVEALIIAKVFSLALASLLYLYYFFHSCAFEDKKVASKEVKKYVKNIFVVSLLKKLNMQVLLFYMALFVSNVLIGLYYIAERIVSYAVEMPIAALSETMLPFASEKASNKKALSSLVSLSIKFSLILGLLLGLVILVIGKILLIVLFPNFINAYPLLPLFIVLFLSSSIQFLNNAYRSINRADIIVKSLFLTLFVTLTLGYFLIANYAIYGLLIVRVITNLLAGAFLYFKQRSVGLQIEIIPRFKDLRFFVSVFKRAVKRIVLGVCFRGGKY